MGRFYLFFIAFAIVLISGCGGGGGNNGTEFTVGDIKGPATIKESASAQYSIQATGDELTYLWSVDPAGAGSIPTPDDSSISFHANTVAADAPAKIQVAVHAKNNDPVVKRCR